MAPKLIVPANILAYPCFAETVARMGYEAVSTDETRLDLLVLLAREAGACGSVPITSIHHAQGLPFALDDDKSHIRKYLKDADVPQPEWVVKDNEPAVRAFADRAGLPVVIKPCTESRSRGVQLVKDAEDISLAMIQAHKAHPNGFEQSLIAEEYVPGSKFVIDAVIIDGRFHLQGVVEEMPEDPYCHAMSAVAPARIEVNLHEALAVAAPAFDALCLKNVCGHVELGRKDGRWLVIRMSVYPTFLRYPADLIRLAGGVDTVANCIRACAGEQPEPYLEPKKGAAVAWIHAGSGVVEGVDGIAAARAMPGVTDVQVHIQPGDTLGHITDGITRDRIGQVVATGTNADEALANARAAAQSCKILTSPLIKS